jgi:hypothetical protein
MRPFLTTALLTLAIAASPLRAQEARHTVSGTLLDGASNDGIATAWVQIEDTRVAAVTDSAGRFVLDRVPAGLRSLEISRVGYVTLRETLIVEGDMTVTVTMTPKPIVLEGIQVTLDRLAFRRNALPYAVSVFDEEAMFRTNALDAADFVERRAGLLMVPCPTGEVACVLSRGGRAHLGVVIDDRPAFAGISELVGFPMSEIDQVEVVRRCPMVRVYTKRFMEQLATGKRRLHPFLDCGGAWPEPRPGRRELLTDFS